MNRAARFLVIVWLVIAAGASIRAACAESRYALVIGNVAYSGPAARLANPVRDAEFVAETLRKLGFDVTLGTNLSRSATYAAIDRYTARLTGDAVGLVFYSGHGIGFKGANYLIPVDGWPRDPASLETDAVPLSELVGRLSRRRNRLNIVIIDACRDNPFSHLYRSVDQGFAAATAPTGMILAFSTAPGTPALDGAGQTHSPYAQALGQAMLQKGVPIERMFKNIRQEVGNATRGEQIPWENSSLAGADFYLAPPDGSPAFVARASAPRAPARETDGVTRGMGSYDWLADYAEIESRLRYLAKDELPRLMKDAKRGDSLSQTLLGDAYRDGVAGLERSNQRAMQWFQRAADRDNAIAQHELANFYYAGRGLSKSPERAFKLVSRSAELGFPPAIATLGQFYLEGVGTAPDVVKGIQLISEASGYSPLFQRKGAYQTEDSESVPKHVRQISNNKE